MRCGPWLHCAPTARRSSDMGRLRSMTVLVLKRTDDTKGFKVLLPRWVIERTSAWICTHRILPASHESSNETGRVRAAKVRRIHHWTFGKPRTGLNLSSPNYPISPHDTVGLPAPTDPRSPSVEFKFCVVVTRPVYLSTAHSESLLGDRCMSRIPSQLHNARRLRLRCQLRRHGTRAPRLQ